MEAAATRVVDGFTMRVLDKLDNALGGAAAHEDARLEGDRGSPP
jgi:hypothetical protein